MLVLDRGGARRAWLRILFVLAAVVGSVYASAIVPTAANDDLFFLSGASVSGNVTANDGSTVGYTIVVDTNPVNGNLNMDPNTGAFTYTQTTTAVFDSFTYHLHGVTDTPSGKVNIVSLGWSQVANAPSARRNSYGTIIQDTFYMFGGDPGTGSDGALYKLDILGNTWTQLATIPTILQTYSGMAAIGGKLYVVGGYDGTHAVGTLWIYDPGQNTWSAGDPLPAGATNRLGTFTGIHDKLYLVGGIDDSGTFSTVTYIYDPSASSGNHWTTGAGPNTPRKSHVACAVGGKLWIARGTLPTNLLTQDSEFYDPAKDKWIDAGNDVDSIQSSAIYSLMGVPYLVDPGSNGANKSPDGASLIFQNDMFFNGTVWNNLPNYEFQRNIQHAYAGNTRWLVKASGTAANLALTAESEIISLPASISKVSLPKIIHSGRSGTGRIVLRTWPATANQTVNLSADNSVIVPSTVTILANMDYSQPFPITCPSVANDTVVTVTATNSFGALSNTFTIAAPQIGSIVGAHGSIQEGNPITMFANLDGVPLSDTVVNITSSDTGATFPSTVTVKAGQTFNSFRFVPGPIATNGNITVTGTLNSLSQSFTLGVTRVQPLAIKFLTSPSVSGRDTQTRVTLTGFAPTGGVTVNLSTNDPNVTNLPTSVFVPGGSNISNEFLISTNPTNSTITPSISASRDTNISGIFEVDPPTVTLLSLHYTTVKGGGDDTAMFWLNGLAPSGSSVSVSTSDTNLATVSTPNVATNDGHPYTVGFVIHTKPVVTQQTVTITWSFNGATGQRTITIVP